MQRPSDEWQRLGDVTEKVIADLRKKLDAADQGALEQDAVAALDRGSRHD